MSVMPAHNRALCLYDGYDCRIPLQLPLLTLSLKYSFQSEALLVSCISTAWGPLSSTSHYFKFHSHGWHGIQDVYKAGVWSWTAVRRMWRQVTRTLRMVRQSAIRVTWTWLTTWNAERLSFPFSWYFHTYLLKEGGRGVPQQTVSNTLGNREEDQCNQYETELEALDCDCQRYTTNVCNFMV